MIKLLLAPARYTTSTGAVRGSWGLQVHIKRAFPRRIQRNVDESRCGRGQLTFKAPPLLERSPFFSGYEVYIFVFGLFVVLRVLVWFWSCSFQHICFSGSGRTPQTEAHDCRSLVDWSISPCRRPPQPGAGGTLFARNVVQDYVRACVSSYF